MTNIDRRARDTDRLGYSSVAALSFAGANQGGQPNTKRSSYLSELRTAEHQSTVFRPRNRARVHVRPSGQFGSRPTLLFTEVPEHCPEIRLRLFPSTRLSRMCRLGDDHDSR